VNVVCLFRRGVAIDRRELRSLTGVRGDLYVEEHTDSRHGRTLRMARLAPEQPRDKALLPSLGDARLLWMGANGFVLAGFEQVDEIEFGQSWWCRMP